MVCCWCCGIFALCGVVQYSVVWCGVVSCGGVVVVFYPEMSKNLRLLQSFENPFILCSNQRLQFFIGKLGSRVLFSLSFLNLLFSFVLAAFRIFLLLLLLLCPPLLESFTFFFSFCFVFF